MATTSAERREPVAKVLSLTEPKVWRFANGGSVASPR